MKEIRELGNHQRKYVEDFKNQFKKTYPDRDQNLTIDIRIFDDRLISVCMLSKVGYVTWTGINFFDFQMAVEKDLSVKEYLTKQKNK